MIKVHDMAKVLPFEGAANKTSLFVTRKGEVTKFPISYTVWKKREQVDPSDSLQMALSRTSRIHLFASPSQSDQNSAWATTPTKDFGSITRIFGKTNITKPT